MSLFLQCNIIQLLAKCRVIPVTEIQVRGLDTCVLSSEQMHILCQAAQTIPPDDVAVLPLAYSSQRCHQAVPCPLHGYPSACGTWQPPCRRRQRQMTSQSTEPLTEPSCCPPPPADITQQYVKTQSTMY